MDPPRFSYRGFPELAIQVCYDIMSTERTLFFILTACLRQWPIISLTLRVCDIMSTEWTLFFILTARHYINLTHNPARIGLDSVRPFFARIWEENCRSRTCDCQEENQSWRETGRTRSEKDEFRKKRTDAYRWDSVCFSCGNMYGWDSQWSFIINENRRGERRL